MNYSIPIRIFLKDSYTLQIMLTPLFIGVPVLFAGIIFALTFKKAREPHKSLGSNILGCIIGGISEYICMIYGIKSLYILAIIFYISSFIAVKVTRST